MVFAKHASAHNTIDLSLGCGLGWGCDSRVTNHDLAMTGIELGIKLD